MVGRSAGGQQADNGIDKTFLIQHSADRHIVLSKRAQFQNLFGGCFGQCIAQRCLGIDKGGKLWISWENNRFAHRLQDSDNYTGDRCCAMVCYENGQILEQKENGRWLFQGMNDHWPTFRKDLYGNLYALTHCGGDFKDNPHWKFRIPYLDPETGWSKPEIILKTKQK